MTLKVIGAGWGRTGTDSLRAALDLLGLGPCHHMREVAGNEAQTDLWDRKSLGEDISWDTIYEGYSAAVDWPTAAVWEDLLGAYPDARIILTYREPESWYASFEKTLLPILRRIEASGDYGMVWRLVAQGEFGGVFGDKNECLSRYAAHIEHVRKTAPRDQLYEMQLGEGWKGLCEFLGVDVPDEPYPSGNTTGEFRETTKLDE